MNAFTQAPLADRFGVPAFIAAAFHVVLLFAFDPTARPPITRITEIPLTVLPPIPPEPFVPPTPPEKSDVVAPVKALNPGPVRPPSEDRSIPDVTALQVGPIPGIKPTVPTRLDKIPDGFGDGTPGQPVPGDIANAKIFSGDQLDRTPRAKVQPAPEYPFALRQAGIEGSVVVEFEVDTAGQVVTARALNGTTPEFAQAAVRAVLKWRFEPGRKDGRAVPFRMVVPIGFSLSAD